MKRFLFALVCAMMVCLSSSAFGADDTYSCDAFAEYIADNKGTIAHLRRQWHQVTYRIGWIRKENDLQTIVFFSGDADIDKRYRHTAPAYKGTMSKAQILDWMAKAPFNETLDQAHAKSVQLPKEDRMRIRALQSNAVCWRNGDPPPDRSAWPSSWTCKGAVYFRLRLGDDLSHVHEYVMEKTGLTGPETAAWSELRKVLIDYARAKALRDTGDAEKFVLDTVGGQANETPIKCWNGMRKGAPVDWRGPTMW